VTDLLPARILDLGVRDFADVWGIQRELVAARQRDEVPDTLIFVEHPHVITLGRGTHRENLVAVGDIPTFEIERGGDVTYHGPGQLVGYPIFLLRQEERDLHLYLRNMEECLLRTVADFGIAGERNPGWTGAWTEVPKTDETTGGKRKLASIGVAVKRWVTMHGFALNVSTDLSRFSAINPCGLEANVMASISSVLGQPIDMESVKASTRTHFGDVFNRAFA
jgi:lipoyl(octanoyl) transferase